MPKLTVISGPNTFILENESIENVADLFGLVRDQLDLPANATITVDGAAAGPDTILTDGAEVAFDKATGAKGV